MRRITFEMCFPSGKKETGGYAFWHGCILYAVHKEEGLWYVSEPISGNQLPRNGENSRDTAVQQAKIFLDSKSELNRFRGIYKAIYRSHFGKEPYNK